MTEPTKTINILLVDDHPIVLEGLRARLQTEDRFSIVGEALGGKEAVEMAKSLSPHVILMDLTMPGVDGLEAARQIAKAGVPSKVLILSMEEDSEYLAKSLQAGVSGFVTKSANPSELVKAIETVAGGSAFFCSNSAAKLGDIFSRDTVRKAERGRPVNVSERDRNPPKLSPRENAILEMIADGLPNPKIAETFKISVRTVETHRQRIMDKLCLHNSSLLVRFALSRRQPGKNKTAQLAEN